MALEIARTQEELSRRFKPRRDLKRRIGFVPTMGALHEGHLSLERLARENADVTVASIFVNPTQFAPHEDFNAYPRHEMEDLALLQSAGADVVYLPTESVIYPQGKIITTQAGAAAQGLETDFRLHFFGGVATVVRTLFEHVGPDIAVFGEKDYQQLQVIREMVVSCALPVEIIGAPIIRDEHGLALSSRNAYLSAEELTIARTLNGVLLKAAEQIHPPHPTLSPLEGERDAQGWRGKTEPTPKLGEGVVQRIRQKLLAAGFDKVDYVEARWGRLLAAAWLGKTRLIDNIPLKS